MEKELSRQRKEIEKLREVVQLQDIILGKSPSGYYIVQNGVFTLMNSVAISFTGYSPGELIGEEGRSCSSTPMTRNLSGRSPVIC